MLLSFVNLWSISAPQYNPNVGNISKIQKIAFSSGVNQALVVYQRLGVAPKLKWTPLKHIFLPAFDYLSFFLAEKEWNCWKRWFWPADSMQSTHSFVEIHNSLYLTKFVCLRANKVLLQILLYIVQV